MNTKKSDNTHPIYVTQPNLPPMSEFVPYLEKIWANKILTNGGQFHEELETALCEYLGVKHISLFCNGTIALITAIKAMNLSGDVITTPYTFVATTHAVLWNGLNPIFADVDPRTFNLSPESIEALITPATSAIMPVHCYGYPCDVEKIKSIADKHNLKVLYDASHAFGVRDSNNLSLLLSGDLSVLSFHATKVFNTFEGGAIVCPDAVTKRYIDKLKNFGYVDEVTVDITGINGKLNEVQAAFGLVNLKHVDADIAARARIDSAYRNALKDVKGIRIPVFNGGKHNYAYFPILVGEGYPQTRDGLFNSLKKAGINARRYFYPLISDFPMYREMHAKSQSKIPEATRIADEVICLPIYPSLSEVDVHRIIGHITNK